MAKLSPFMLYPELCKIHCCGVCGSLFVPNQWDSFGSGPKLGPNGFEMGSGTCDSCYPDRSVLDLSYFGSDPDSPSKQRAREILAKLPPITVDAKEG